MEPLAAGELGCRPLATPTGLDSSDRHFIDRFQQQGLQDKKMLKNIRELFNSSHPLAKDKNGEPIREELQIAAAVLLLEIACGDEEFDREERAAIVEELSTRFHLSTARAKRVLNEASNRHQEFVSVEPWVEEINDKFSEEQKLEILVDVLARSIRTIWTTTTGKILASPTIPESI